MPAGATMLPALACATLPAGLTALRMEMAGMRRVVGLIRRSNTMHSPLANAFVTHLNHGIKDVLSHSIGLSAHI